MVAMYAEGTNGAYTQLISLILFVRTELIISPFEWSIYLSSGKDSMLM